MIQKYKLPLTFYEDALCSETSVRWRESTVVCTQLSSFCFQKMAAGDLVKEAFSPTIRYYGVQCPLQQSVEFNSNDFSVTE